MSRPARKPQAEPSLLSNAQVIAHLQAMTLALRLGGLDGLRTGQVVVNSKPEGTA